MKYGSWKISGYNRDTAVRLCRSGINALVSVVLASRGVKDPDVYRVMRQDSVELIHDPHLLKGMDEAAARVRRAVENREHVAVYGDYDVDGITGTCLLTEYFRSKGLECEMYIPNRLEEGYGVKKHGVELLAKKGVTLIVTVDCGITAVGEVQFAKELGVDMVITDHHECGDTLPDTAVVNPKRHDCPYPDKMLAGVGVAFKLICAVDGAQNTEELLKKYGDLVAVGTIADVMPVIGENRIFILRGLELVRRGVRPGLDKLCEAAGIDKKQITVTGVSFSIAPRLNAAGRLVKTAVATSLLLTKDPREAETLASELCALNRRRQELETEMFDSALKMLKASPPDGKPIVLVSSSWHQGVAGIVASKVSERYRLPAIMICLQNGKGRGSCRSYGNFNIYDALEGSSGWLEGFGGHAMAAGLTVMEQNIDGFKESLAEFYREKVKAPFEAVLDIDFEVVKPGLLTVENVTALGELEPYGTGNPKPTLCIRDAEIHMVIPLGGGKHTKLLIRKWNEYHECIFFSRSVDQLGVQPGGMIDIAFVPQINEFRGKRTVQLLLDDIFTK
ncbi:MAG: single-stranded-DNA-specific exonuclease RecJ [Ruminococcaceae bacterium]|nr:single-stranded-DNA-specific exonuclease RecJ [Oscillospiraceae bacterium]